MGMLFAVVSSSVKGVPCAILTTIGKPFPLQMTTVLCPDASEMRRDLMDNNIAGPLDIFSILVTNFEIIPLSVILGIGAITTYGGSGSVPH
jgi:hypothetical protein